jgi:hypothetical protein
MCEVTWEEIKSKIDNNKEYEKGVSIYIPLGALELYESNPK